MTPRPPAAEKKIKIMNYHHYHQGKPPGGGGGGVLGPKNDGGVPLAAENWTQKDRGKNEIWGLKDRIL